jgi:hypothetical protein
MTDHKIADLKFEKEFSLPHEEYTVFINDEKKELYIRPYFSVDRSDNKATRVEVRKRSSGRTEIDAMKKSEELQFNYNINGDTLHLDEYFTIPAERKWSADNIGINLYIPKGTILKFEKDSRIILHSSFKNEYDEYPESGWESVSSLWVMTDDGLDPIAENTVKQK